VARERAKRESVIRELFKGAERINEIRHGIEARFDGDGRWLRQIVELVVAERECCRFLRFEITAEPDEGPFVLRVTGPEGTEQVLETWLQV